jgi:hypothetical protein
MAEKDIKHW